MSANDYTASILAVPSKPYFTKQLVEEVVALYLAVSSGHCSSYWPIIAAIQRIATAACGSFLLVAMAYRTSSRKMTILMCIGTLAAYVAGDDPGPTVYGNTTGSPEDDGSVHSLQTGPFYARYGATGAAGFVAWNSANGATFFDKAVMYCQEASEGKGTASGARCVFNAMNYAIGCGVAITASVYFTDHILSGAGHAMQFVNGGGAKRSLNDCDTNPERCDALSQHLVLMMPDHHDHRVAQIMRDDTEVANGHRFTLQKSGRHVAHVSVNSTHHVLKMGQDLPVGPKARRDFLPTANHYYNWQGQLAGLKVEGKNFDQPADPTSYIANLRTTISGLGNNGAYQTDSTPFTACSKYKHDKIYDGKFVFEGASFGDNFETYYTFACPDALK